MNTRISVDPAIHFGKPCIRNTRIPVYEVLALVRGGLSFEKILVDYYPSLKEEDIQACLQYAMDVMEAEDLHVQMGA